jgi:hypothetical protein
MMAVLVLSVRLADVLMGHAMTGLDFAHLHGGGMRKRNENDRKRNDQR